MFGMTILVSYQGGRLRRPLLNIREKVIPNVKRNLYNFTGKYGILGTVNK